MAASKWTPPRARNTMLRPWPTALQTAIPVPMTWRGAANWPDEVIDNVVLESDLFAPYRLGQQAMIIKASEQLMISIAYMTLEAVNQGLGSCWVGTVASKDAHRLMNLPDSLFVHDLFAIGYPGEFPAPRPRKEFDKILFWEKYE